MNAGWWILMILLILGLLLLMYGGVFLLWLHRHGGVHGLRDELIRRLGK